MITWNGIDISEVSLGDWETLAAIDSELPRPLRRLYDPEIAAVLLGLNEQAIYRMMKSGKLIPDGYDSRGIPLFYLSTIYPLGAARSALEFGTTEKVQHMKHVEACRAQRARCDQPQAFRIGERVMDKRYGKIGTIVEHDVKPNGVALVLWDDENRPKRNNSRYLVRLNANDEIEIEIT
jgi:hypothetical protein